MSAQSPAWAPRPRPAERLVALPAELRWLAGLTVLAAALRFATLDVQSFWLDEAVTVNLLGLPFGEMWSGIPFSESTPPLYYVVAWLWSQPFGLGEVGLRSLSALFGTATVPLAYLAAARIATPRVGVTVAALAAVNPLLVWISQEARAYALLVLLATAAFAVFARLLDHPTTRGLAGWALLSAAALATHYFAIFVIAPQAVWLLWCLRGDRRRVLAALAGVAVAGAALLPLMIEQAGNDRANFIDRIGLVKRLAQVPKQFLVGFDAPLEAATTVVALALAGVALWLLVTRSGPAERRGASTAARIAVPALAIPLVLAVIGLDYLIARNVVMAWVPVAIVLAAGLGARGAGRVGIATTAVLCALSLLVVVAGATSAEYQRGDWRAVARTLGPLTEPRALVITPPYGDVPLGIYSEGELSRLPDHPLPLREIHVIAIAERATGQTPEPPRPEQLFPPPPGFELIERRDEVSYTLLRYGAEQFQYVYGWQLLPMKLGEGFPEMRVQTPTGWMWVPPGTPSAPTPPGTPGLP